MSQIYDAIKEIDKFEQLAKRDQWVNRIHPLVKLLLTIFYIAITVSFGKYDASGLLVMAIYPIVLFNVADLSFADAMKRLRIILPLVCIVGVLNPFFDREIIIQLAGLGISGGVISMISLMIKGILTVLAGYILIATTTIEDLCYALRCAHVPKILVVVILLIYRYISVFLVEVSRVTTAYSLRAPGQKGLHYKVWGPLVGQMLLRSMDRANAVYESMSLRGFRGEFYYKKKMEKRWADGTYLLVWLLVFFVLRYGNIAERIGGIFVA